MGTADSLLPADMRRFAFNANLANMYVFAGENEALIVDCCDGPELDEFLSAHHIRRVTVILTHGHWDHVSGVENLIGRYECRVCAGARALDELRDPRKNLSRHFEALFRMRVSAGLMPPEAMNMDFGSCSIVPDVCFEDGEEFCWGDHRFLIRHTPGHTEGSICILADGKYLFSGDSLLNGSRTVTRYPTGSRRAFYEITAPFFESLPGDITVLPGHGEPDKLEKLISFLYEERAN